jgi:SAM-dependent methyltransferase
VEDFDNFSSDCAKIKTDILVFNEYGSDKDSRHSYGSTYFALLKGARTPSILEIGIGSVNKYPYAGNPPGGALRTFKKYFPDSLLIGADIDSEAIKVLMGYDIIGFRVDQTSNSSLSGLKDEVNRFGKFDLVIDDGLHEPHANLKTLRHLFDCVKDGGHYVVEDVHGSLINFWKLISVKLPGKMEVLDMSEKRAGVKDNVLIIFHKNCPT